MSTFGSVVRGPQVDLGLACLLLAGELDDELASRAEQARQQLDALAGQVPPTGGGAERLRAVLGRFGTLPEDYGDLRASLLPEVLRRGHGLPILVSVVWLEVARRAGVQAEGVGLPGHFVVRVEGLLVDPARGGAPWRHRPGDAELARAWEPVEVLARVLANVRAWASDPSRPERLRVRLRAVGLALELPRHAAALRREHGELRVRTGDFLGGARELEAYAEVLAEVDPEGAEQVRREARMARAQLN